MVSPKLLRLGLGAAFAALLALASANAQAQDLQISGFSLEGLNSSPPGVRLVVRTSTGDPIPANRIQFKAKGRVVRVTFADVPMVSELGIKADLEPRGTNRVEKGYAVAESDAQCFVRLRFDDDVDVAMKNHRIAPGEGGTLIDFPFGAALPPLAGAEVAAAEEPAAEEPAAEEPAAEEPAKEEPAAEAPAAEEPAEEDKQPAEEPAATAATAAPATAAPTAATPEPAAAPAPRAGESGPKFNLDDPFGPLAVMLIAIMAVLLLVLVFIWARAKPQPATADTAAPGASPLAPTDVQLLARYSLGEHSELLVVRILGEVFVIGNGPLTLLRRMSAEPQGDVWGAVDDVQRKLRELLLQMQEHNPRGSLPDGEVAAIMEKIEGQGQTIDFQEALLKRRQQRDAASGEDEDAG
jgi:flagellar biogenesis protein FliO